MLLEGLNFAVSFANGMILSLKIECSHILWHPRICRHMFKRKPCKYTIGDLCKNVHNCTFYVIRTWNWFRCPAQGEWTGELSTECGMVPWHNEQLLSRQNEWITVAYNHITAWYHIVWSTPLPNNKWLNLFYKINFKTTKIAKTLFRDEYNYNQI